MKTGTWIVDQPNYCPYWQLKFSFLILSTPVQLGGEGIRITAILWSVFSRFYEHPHIFSCAEHFMKDKQLCQPCLHPLNLNKNDSDNQTKDWHIHKNGEITSFYRVWGFLRNSLNISQHQGQNYWHPLVILPPTLPAQNHPSCNNCYPSF